jgi:hypothetical protein
MGLNNFIQQKILKNEAKRLAVWAAEKYPVVKAQNPHADEREIHKLIWLGDLSVLAGRPEHTLLKIDNCCESINGLCYMLSMEVGALKGALALRCRQFTEYMDRELLARGFAQQTPETKRRVLRALGLDTSKTDSEATFQQENKPRSGSIGDGRGMDYTPTAEDYKELREYKPQVRDVFTSTFLGKKGENK